MKSLEPYQKKLGTDTWFYTKRCFLALFENMAKHLIILKDPFVLEIIQFLTHCESIDLKLYFKIYISKWLYYALINFKAYGKDVKANIQMPMEQDQVHPGRNTVAYEARYLKWLLYEIIDFWGAN